MILNEVPLNTMVTIFTESIEDEFIYGFLIAQDEERIILACVDHYGEEDGFILLPQEGIYRADFDSNYEKRVESLYHLKEQQHKEISLADDTLMEDLLQWAYKNKKVITIGYHDGDWEVSGYLDNLEEYKIRQIDLYECKAEQGTAWVDPQKASYIRVDSKRARDAVKIYQHRGEF